jgi:hypothetical protein
VLAVGLTSASFAANAIGVPVSSAIVTLMGGPMNRSSAADGWSG